MFYNSESYKLIISIEISTLDHTKSTNTYSIMDESYPTRTFTFDLNGNKIIAEYITKEKVEDIKNFCEVRDEKKNYNQIIDGHGTGYAPPTIEDLEKLVGKVSILDVIPENSYDPPKASADLSTEIYFPPIGDQGSQGSCGAWASTYYTYGYLEAKDYGWDASSGNPDYLMSPAWTFNKVTTTTGSWMTENAQILLDWGCATMSSMPYDDSDVNGWANETAWREAPYHRAYDYYLMDFDEGNPDSTIDDIKSMISSGSPVSFTLDAYEYDDGFLDGNYIISSTEYTSTTLNHANCIVGYDDSISDDGDTGAFRVVNSWGTSWGDSGYYWLTYDAVKEIGFALGDFGLHLCVIEDRIDYLPSLMGTWEFDPAPTRMEEIITLGVGPYDTPLANITPWYNYDDTNLFPEFMSLDISDFQSYYIANNEVNFFLDVGSSTTTGTISSFKIERYVSGILEETTPESLEVPETTPVYVNTFFADLDHDLKVLLEVPSDPELYDTYILNATVINNGIYDESDIELFLYLDGEIINSTTISLLPIGANKTINYTWIPSEMRMFNFTAYAPPLSQENYRLNNIKTSLLKPKKYVFFDDFESGLSKWDSITGLWHHTDPSSTCSDPSHSPTHGMWFGDNFTGTYNTGQKEMGNFSSISIDLSNCSTAFLDFYHWRETEDLDGYDMSYVYISTDGLNWVPIYDDWLSVATWEKVVLNISEYAGYPSVQIMFHFDTVDSMLNNYVGWVVDDIGIYSNEILLPPKLTNGSVNPKKGDQSDLLIFSVTYTDWNNDLPSYVNIVINGTGHPMDKQNLYDDNYIDGCLYQYQTLLQSAPYNYSYHFECSDGIFSNSTMIYNDLQILYSNSYVPTLSNGQVNPSSGKNNLTIFTFSVNYIDADNNFPTSITVTINSDTHSMVKQNPSDNNYMDGCIYRFSSLLFEIGTHTFSFSCSDGGTTVNAGPFSGPIVEEVIILPSDFDLSTDADNPDIDGSFDLFWIESDGAVNYSVYQHLSYINRINGSLTLLEEGFTNLSIALSGYGDGIYFFIVVAHNKFGDTLSNCLEIVVRKQRARISGYNLLYLIGFISIIILIITLKKHRKIK